jgi:predicted nucleic acid-binding protein
MNQRTVVDASVAVKWFTREQHRAQAVKLRDAHIAGETTLTAPFLLVYEVTNALRYNPSLTADDLEQAVQALYTIAIEYVPPTQESMTQAATTAKHLNVTVFDACYLTLSSQLDAPLVTADTRLAQRAPEHNIISLDSL